MELVKKDLSRRYKQYYFILIVLIFISGCGGTGGQDTGPPQVISLSIEANDTCNIGGVDVSCLHRNSPFDLDTIGIHLVAIDDTGISGYYISETDSLIPSNWISVIPPTTSYDDIINYNLVADGSNPHDGIKRVSIWVKDLGGNVSQVASASLMRVTGRMVENEVGPIEEGKSFSDGLLVHYLKIDNTGVRVLAGGPELFFLTRTNTTWSFEKIEGFDMENRYSGVYVDENDNIHISFPDSEGHLTYSTNSSGVWESVVVDSTVTSGEFTDIVKGSDGKISISYYDTAQRNLMYASCNNGCTDKVNWETSIIDNSNDDTGLYSAITTGDGGSIHIAYYDRTNSQIKYVSSIDGFQPQIAGTNAGIRSDITVDSNGDAHITYYDNSTGQLYYSTNKSGAWSGGISIDKDSVVKDFISIHIASTGSVNISYYDSKNGDLRYATCMTQCEDPANWSSTVIDETGDTGWFNLISEDPVNGEIHISYFNFSDKSIKHAMCNSACNSKDNWKVEDIVSSGDAGIYNSMVIDSNGDIHTSYIAGGFLKYAVNRTGKWFSTVVDREGGRGKATSIAVDPVDLSIHIAYYDAIEKGIKYATCSTNCEVFENWQHIIVKKGSGGGMLHPSIKIDMNEAIHISYQDGDTRSLEYAYCSANCLEDGDNDGIGENWGTVIVDGNKPLNTGQTSSLDIGQYSSIAVDNTGATVKIHISYFDATNGDLKHAFCESNCVDDKDNDSMGDNWIVEVVDKGDDNSQDFTNSVGSYTSMGIDGEGGGHISYYDDTEGALKYANNKSGEWSTIVIDNYDLAGLYSSMSINPIDNSVHIVYFRLSSNLSVLKYAYCKTDCILDIDDGALSGHSDGIGDNWNTYILKIFSKSGMSASISLSPDIHIIYFDVDKGGLYYLDNLDLP